MPRSTRRSLTMTDWRKMISHGGLRLRQGPTPQVGVEIVGNSTGTLPVSPPDPRGNLQGLDFLWLELTGKCNLQCVHCYAGSGPYASPTELTLEDWVAVLEEGYALGCRRVQFIGGEPTLYKGLVELIERARRIGYEFVEVFTNGIHFSEAVRAVFRKERVHLAFSLYSSDPLVHESITLQPGSFKRTLSSIRWAVANNLPTRAAIIAMTRNKSGVEETRHFLADVGVQRVVVDRIRGVGRGSSEAVSTDPLDELCGDCWNGKLCVTGSGDVYPCIMARFARVGGINEGLDHLIRTTELVAFRSQVFGRYAPGPSFRYESECAPNVPDRIKCAPQAPCGPSASSVASCAPGEPAPWRPPPAPPPH